MQRKHHSSICRSRDLLTWLYTPDQVLWVGVLQVRLAGDRYVLVEYGPMELDLNLRVRIWALQAHLADAKVRPVEKEVDAGCAIDRDSANTGCTCLSCTQRGMACPNTQRWVPCRHEVVLCLTPADSLSLQHHTVQRSSQDGSQQS